MKIRSITYFLNPNWPLDGKKLRQAGEFLTEAREAFESSGYEVQTTRLATVPFPHLLGEKKINDLPQLAGALEAALPSTGAAYASLGPALIEAPESYAVIPEAIAATQNIFFSGEMASSRKGLSLAAVQACAEVIARCAPITPDGFANLRFAALANVPAGAPFFPAAYHEGEQIAFALATEAADLAVEAFTRAASVEDGRNALVHALEENARKLAKAADFLKYKFNIRFGGIDYSLAPFPAEAQSLGTAMERLGVPAVGLHGSLAAAAILTEAIDRANFPRCGFSGLMLPVLEDSTLARRAAEGTLTVKDLLLYSAVCGTGLDTVPLSGDVPASRLTPLLLDLAALALRLDKPLTARLMPIPGKQAGDPTGFDFEFFANSKVMALESQGTMAALANLQSFDLSPKR
ncbi:MAG: DUF711 family protein [Chloroflexota bacterium]